MHIAGGILWFAAVTIYVAVIMLAIIVLIRLYILLPILTKFAKLGCMRLDPNYSTVNNARRLLELEDLQRMNRITPEEYAAKRQDILNDL
jgi:hypothetical protein